MMSSHNRLSEAEGAVVKTRRRLPMSQQDVETIRGGYDAFNRKDIPAVLERFNPQIEWHEPGGGRAPVGTFMGPQSVANDVFATVPQNFDEFKAEAERFIDAGEYVVVVGRFGGRSKRGSPLDAPFVHVWTMRGGKASRFQQYVETAAWAKAWGD
jgi:ketosteroid isomerase-like protein